MNTLFLTTFILEFYLMKYNFRKYNNFNSFAYEVEEKRVKIF